MSERRIEMMDVEALTPARRNPKLHSDDIGKSIDRFGFADAIVLDDRTDRIIGGHGRRSALIELKRAGATPPDGIVVDATGAWLVPVQRGWSSKNDTEAEALLLAENQITIAGDWDHKMLLEILSELGPGPEIEGLGFSEKEIAEMLEPTAVQDGAADKETAFLAVVQFESDDDRAKFIAKMTEVGQKCWATS